jgi:hypothetical protein
VHDLSVFRIGWQHPLPKISGRMHLARGHLSWVVGRGRRNREP